MRLVGTICVVSALFLEAGLVASTFECQKYMESEHKEITGKYLGGSAIHQLDRLDQQLSEKIINDLELDSLGNAISKPMLTVAGKKRLKWLLKNPSVDALHIRSVQQAVKYLLDHPEAYQSLKKLLQTIHAFEENRTFWNRFFEWSLNKIGLNYLIPTKSFDAAIEFFNKDRDWWFEVRRLFRVVEAPVLMTGAYFFGSKAALSYGLSAYIASSNISKQRQNRADLGQLKFLFQTADVALKTLANSNSNYLNDLAAILNSVNSHSNEQKNVPLGKYIRGLRTDYVTASVLDFTFISNLSLYRANSLAYQEVHKLALIASVVSELDVLVLFADLAKSNTDIFVFPEIVDDENATKISIKDGLNPMLLFNERKVVPNDVSISSVQSEDDLPQIIFVTGPQARGKSTYVRMVAQNVILAQSGAPVPAASMALTPIYVVSTMKNSDSTIDDESRFRAEAGRVNDLIEKARKNPRALVILDEVFSGTSHEEKIAMEEALMIYLQKLGCMVMASSHSRDLVGLEGRVKGFKNFHASDSIERMFQMEAGPSKVRNAFTILKEEGVPQELIDDARQLYQGPAELEE